MKNSGLFAGFGGSYGRPPVRGRPVMATPKPKTGMPKPAGGTAGVKAVKPPVPPKAPPVSAPMPLAPQVSTKPTDKPLKLMTRQINKNMGLTPQGKLPIMPKLTPKAGMPKVARKTTPKTGRA